MLCVGIVTIQHDGTLQVIAVLRRAHNGAGKFLITRLVRRGIQKPSISVQQDISGSRRGIIPKGQAGLVHAIALFVQEDTVSVKDLVRK